MYDAISTHGETGNSETLTILRLSDSFTDMAGNGNGSVSYQWQHGTERSSESFLESRVLATIGVTVGIVVTGSIALHLIFKFNLKG